MDEAVSRLKALAVNLSLRSGRYGLYAGLIGSNTHRLNTSQRSSLSVRKSSVEAPPHHAIVRLISCRWNRRGHTALL